LGKGIREFKDASDSDKNEKQKNKDIEDKNA
jgi:Sec-independent protein translocase protein TatA